MRLLTVLYLLLFPLLVTFSASAQPTTVKIRPLEGYFILDEHLLEKKINCLVIDNRKDFIKYFGLVNRPDTPQFSREIMIVLALEPSKKQSKISLERVTMKAGDYLEVYCGLQLNLFPLTYTAYPIVAGTVPRIPGITTINFYNEKGMKLMASLPIRH